MEEQQEQQEKEQQTQLNESINKPQANWRYLIIVALVAIFIGGGILGYQYWWIPNHETEIPQIETNSRIYRNKLYGFMVEYPRVWQAKEFKKENIGFYEEEIKEYADITIGVEKNPSRLSLTSWLEENRGTLINEYLEDVIIDGIEGKKVSESGLTGYIAVYVTKDTNIYFISIPDVRYEKYQEVYNQILSTFRFIVTDDQEIYRNTDYGFQITLLDSWEGYSILTETWEGRTLDGSSVEFEGPKITIRNPNWDEDHWWQDILIMIFTKNEWKLIEANNLNVSAAPVGPSKLGENQKYVFALPPRWIGFAETLGQEEAREIVKTFIAE